MSKCTRDALVAGFTFAGENGKENKGFGDKLTQQIESIMSQKNLEAKRAVENYYDSLGQVNITRTDKNGNPISGGTDTKQTSPSGEMSGGGGGQGAVDNSDTKEKLTPMSDPEIKAHRLAIIRATSDSQVLDEYGDSSFGKLQLIKSSCPEDKCTKVGDDLFVTNYDLDDAVMSHRTHDYPSDFLGGTNNLKGRTQADVIEAFVYVNVKGYLVNSRKYRGMSEEFNAPVTVISKDNKVYRFYEKHNVVKMEKGYSHNYYDMFK